MTISFCSRWWDTVPSPVWAQWTVLHSIFWWLFSLTWISASHIHMYSQPKIWRLCSGNLSFYLLPTTSPNPCSSFLSSTFVISLLVLWLGCCFQEISWGNILFPLSEGSHTLSCPLSRKYFIFSICSSCWCQNGCCYPIWIRSRNVSLLDSGRLDHGLKISF